MGHLQTNINPKLTIQKIKTAHRPSRNGTVEINELIFPMLGAHSSRRRRLLDSQLRVRATQLLIHSALPCPVTWQTQTSSSTLAMTFRQFGRRADISRQTLISVFPVMTVRIHVVFTSENTFAIADSINKIKRLIAITPTPSWPSYFRAHSLRSLLVPLPSVRSALGKVKH